jgi:DNA gyrase/topoisomerase IV subunit A
VAKRKKKSNGISAADFNGDDVVDVLPTNEIVRDSMREYTLFVAGDRAIAHICDGLKPVQRRVAWVLYEGKWTSKAMPVKSARVVGDTMGKYHPHGDASIYGSLINLGWLRHPLVQRIGNYGSRTSLLDLGYAEQRYTETRLSEFGDRLFDDIHVMPMKPTVTEDRTEPRMLPVRAPLLLINGSSGIAVGISADIPPHNLKEVIDATLYLLENPDCETVDLLKYIKGPDYGMGRLLSDKKELVSLYENGKGRLKYGCDYVIEEGSSGVKRLVITGLIPGIQRPRFLRETQKLADKKLLVSPANDEGSLDTGCRIVVEYKDPRIVKDRLLPLLQKTITHNFWALDPKGRPRRYNLKEMLQVFLNFRRRIEKLVLEDQADDLAEKLGVEEAKLQALTDIDLVADVLKTAPSVEEATSMLAKGLSIEPWQAETLLGMPIRSLMRLNQEDIEKRVAKLSGRLRSIEVDLKDLDSVIRRRLEEMYQYGTKRGMSVRLSKAEVLSEAVEGSYYVCLSGSKLEALSDLPLKSKAGWKYQGFVESNGQVLVLSRANVVQFLPITYLDRYEESGVGAALVSGDRKYCFVVTEQGQYAAFETTQKRTRYNVFKEISEPIVDAVGVDPGDTIVVLYDDGSVEKISVPDDPEKGWSRASKRPNIRPKSLRKAGRPLNDMVVIRSSDDLYDGRWRKRPLDKLRTMTDAEAYVVGDVNFVIREDGKRLRLSREETVDLGREGKAQFVIPLYEKGNL